MIALAYWKLKKKKDLKSTFKLLREFGVLLKLTLACTSG